MKQSKRHSHNNVELAKLANRQDSMKLSTKEAEAYWALWQLSIVLRDIAQSVDRPKDPRPKSAGKAKKEVRDDVKKKFIS